MNAYLLSDRGTWLAFRNRGELAIAVQGDRRLFNQYGVMLVNPAKHPNVKRADGQNGLPDLGLVVSGAINFTVRGTHKYTGANFTQIQSTFATGPIG